MRSIYISSSFRSPAYARQSALRRLGRARPGRSPATISPFDGPHFHEPAAPINPGDEFILLDGAAPTTPDFVFCGVRGDGGRRCLRRIY
jgi:hypothetical protein